MRIEIEKGDFLNAPVQWLYFCITNMDITMRLTNQILKLEKESDEQYSGNFLLLKLKMSAIEKKYSSTHGKLQFVAIVKMPFAFSERTVPAYMEYKASDDKTTFLTLECDFVTSGVIMGLYFPLIKCRINAFLRKLFRNFEKVSVLIERDDSKLENRLSEEQLNRIENYRRTCSDLLIDGSSHNTDKKVETLEHEIITLGEKLNIVTDELKKAVDYIQSDPRSSLVKARSALEALLLNLYPRLMSKEPKTSYIGDLLIKDPEFSSQIDSGVQNRMHSVRKFGNDAAHNKPVNSRDASDTLANLAVIFQWYLEYFGSDETDNSPEGRFKAFCRSFYLTGIPTRKDREGIEGKRKEFGFTLERAEELETEVTPQGIAFVKGAIELACVDGDINEKEKKKIYKMAKKHKVRTELVQQLIEEYRGLIEDVCEEEYAELCRSFYCKEDGSVSWPTPEQRERMVRCQNSLGVSDSEAQQIEEEVMPRSLLKLKVAVEQSFSDGMINKDEQNQLKKMADELKISQDVAARLIKECSKRMGKCVIDQFRRFIEQFYQNSIPTSEERKQIEQKRLKLGIPGDVAEEIEGSCVPDEVDKYRAAVEGACASRKIDKNERAFLDKKAEKLGLSPELARQIEEVVLGYFPEFQFSLFVEQFYQNSIPSLEQRDQIEQKRQELGLTEDLSKEIEDSCIPDEIEEYRRAFAAADADHVVNDDERKYLDNLVLELGLSPELAKRIEKECIERRA